MVKRTLTAAVIPLVFAVLPSAVQAQSAERGGKEVVEAVCAACHAKGEQGAPKIGDKKAWAKRASRGLTSLTQHALTGMRKMPSHGGKLELTDLEIGRAVAYMVNQSGGRWKEPASAKDMARERSGKQVVDAQCAKCHAKGEGGAPKIGDRSAWTPRLKQGMDALVLSAIRGYGGMPPRGAEANLTDGEIRSAISFMFNPAAAAPKAKPPSAAAGDSMHKLVAGTDIYLGVLPAETMRARNPGAQVPGGKGYYYVSVVLRDSGTKDEIKDAQVEARVANPLSGETKKLELAKLNDTSSYSNYFQLPGKDPYTVTLQIRKAGAAAPIAARFDLKR